jgi:hypothetical protein
VPDSGENPSPAAPAATPALSLEAVALVPRLRVLCWAGDVLYASNGYTLLSCRMQSLPLTWREVGRVDTRWWRQITARHRLTSRFARDGFHALAVLPSGHLIGAVPGAIVALAPGERRFRTTHSIPRGTRPLNFAVTPAGEVLWGEYFDNSVRSEVHVYRSRDQGRTWNIAHTFPPFTIRHVHNIVYDRWRDCLWVLTGDVGKECQILRASLDWRKIDTVLSGNQQARAVACVPRAEGIYFASDTPLEQNYIYRLDQSGVPRQLAPVSSSVLCGCSVGDNVFFSAMVEPSEVNRDRQIALYGGSGDDWQRLQSWDKDRWPMRFFQYGNAFLPAGENATDFLALTTVAAAGHDLETSIWRVHAAGGSQ